jgi:5,6,7,8-tetrahydromethanopterin hydro-lyase
MDHRIYTEPTVPAIRVGLFRGDGSLLDSPIGQDHTSGLYAGLASPSSSYPHPRDCVASLHPTSLHCRLTLRSSELRMFREILSFFTKSHTEAGMAADFFIGESLVGDGNEIAHIDLIIGSKSGPAGAAFVSALSTNTDGFNHLLAVVTPNLPAKPDTLLFNKVTIKGAKQAVQMFGPAQAAVARAVMDSVSEGVISKQQATDFCVLVGVFIHWQAEDDKKIYQFNYQATKESIARALKGTPTVDEVLAKYKAARHPFAAGAEG